MATNRKLGPDIKALVHHIALNESGWLDRAVLRGIKFLLWTLGGEASRPSGVEYKGEVGLGGVDEKEIENALRQLEGEGCVTQVAPETFRLTIAESAEIEKAVGVAQSTEDSVRTKVLQAAAEATKIPEHASDDQLWLRFHKEFIVPFIEEFGARAYELISGKSPQGGHAAFVQDFLKKYEGSIRASIEAMVHALLDPGSPECRMYVLRLLNAYFLNAATTLPSKTAEKVFTNKGDRRLRLLLDTNFLFSLLGLHENPANDAVRLLNETVSRVPKNIKVGIYVVPGTIDEFRKAITSYEITASEIRPTRAIVEAGAGARIPSILVRFFERCRESGYQISAREYFEPYIENTKSILKEKGVEILQVAESRYAEDQRVIDDVLDRQAFLKQRFKGEPWRQKSYEQIWHDVCLWYSVDDQRAGDVEDFLDADWLGVTIDYSLIAFDEHKRKHKGVPRVVHPSALVQALRLVVPNDESLERTIFSLMRLPFVYSDFDVNDERASLKILSTLSRYENVDDISMDTIEGLLGNKVLKSKISRSHHQDEEFELIREALIDEHRRIEDNLKASISDLTEVVNSEQKRATESEFQSEKLKQQLLEEQEAKTRQEAKLASALSRLDEVERANSDRRNFMVVIAYLAIASMAFLVFAALQYFFLWDYLRNSVGVLPAIGMFLLPLGIVSKGLAWHLSKESYAGEFALSRLILKIGTVVWALMLFGVVSVASPKIGEAYKGLFSSATTSPSESPATRDALDSSE